jgi:hypothetical protein
VLIPVALAWVAVTGVVLVVDINLPRPVLLGAIGVLLVLLLLSFLLPPTDKQASGDTAAPGGSTP